MPAMTKTYLLGGAALLLFLGSKKSSAKSTSGSKTDTGTVPSDQKKEGDVGDPVGPNGCKKGLVEKGGYCIDPNDPKNKDPKNNTGGGGTLASDGLYISNNCDVVKFGDGKGDAWWKNKGEKFAKQWLKAEYTNLIYIAYEMLKSNKEACFKDFPTLEKYPVSFELHKARIDWIIKRPAIWTLLVTIRNLIDKNLLNGKTYVGMVEKNKELLLQFTKDFNFEEFWKSIEPLAYTILFMEEEKPGSVLKRFGYTYPSYDKPGSEVRNSCIVLFVILFPYIDKTKIFKQFSGNLDNTELYNNIWDNISDLENASIDYSEFEKL